MFKKRNATCFRMKGCPVSVSEQVLALVNISGAQNPIFDKTYMKQFNAGYAGAKWGAMKRAFSKPYQKPGVTNRGQAAPQVVPLRKKESSTPTEP